MSDAVDFNSPPPADDPVIAETRPEELPPVEPPSAGYIVQLFLIPALIVAAVIGVWALFEVLADRETDWQQLVQDLGSSNDDRRWRAAFVLAQILRNEEIAPDHKDGPLLADQPKVAQALSNLLRESLASTATDDETIRHQEFLARTLGTLRVDDVVIPALAEALDVESERREAMASDANRNEVRKSCLMALAKIAGRNFEQQAKSAERLEPDRQYAPGEEVLTLRKPLSQPTIANDDVWKHLKQGTQDEEPSVRHLSAFVLGVVSGPEAIAELRAVLMDRDDKTRANAAVGLARNGQTDGVPVLKELLEAGLHKPSGAQFERMSDEEKQALLAQRQFEQPIILGNALRALDSIWVAVPAEQQSDLKPLLKRVADEYHAANVKMQAQKLLNRASGQ